jgi:hypothetical protein
MHDYINDLPDIGRILQLLCFVNSKSRAGHHLSLNKMLQKVKITRMKNPTNTCDEIRCIWTEAAAREDC